MAGYKRMVSYMYQYENGVKKKNVGFARVEARNGECRITIHMQLPGLLDGIFPTYMIQRESGIMELIYIGDTVLKNQVMDSKINTSEVNIMDSGYGLDNMGGILLFLNERVFYATEWDDKPVILNEVMGALKPKPLEKDLKSKTLMPGADKTMEEDHAIPLYKLPRGWKIIERTKSNIDMTDNRKLKADAVKTENNESPKNIESVENSDSSEDNRSAENSDSSEKVKSAAGMNSTENAGGSEDYAGAEESGSTDSMLASGKTGVPEETASTEGKVSPECIERTEKKEQKDYSNVLWRGFEPLGNIAAANTDEDKMDTPLATKLFESYPRIYPFEDTEITQCIKIEPKDIGYLPVEAWVLSNNSFLLHGYYCYNHLILAKKREAKGFRYILGVPGIYHNRERFMARMFGFECFKSIRKRELKQGDFGYWYLPIQL